MGGWLDLGLLSRFLRSRGPPIEFNGTAGYEVPGATGVAVALDRLVQQLDQDRLQVERHALEPEPRTQRHDRQAGAKTQGVIRRE